MVTSYGSGTVIRVRAEDASGLSMVEVQLEFGVGILNANDCEVVGQRKGGAGALARTPRGAEVGSASGGGGGGGGGGGRRDGSSAHSSRAAKGASSSSSSSSSSPPVKVEKASPPPSPSRASPTGGGSVGAAAKKASAPHPNPWGSKA